MLWIEEGGTAVHFIHRQTVEVPLADGVPETTPGESIISEWGNPNVRFAMLVGLIGGQNLNTGNKDLVH